MRLPNPTAAGIFVGVVTSGFVGTAQAEDNALTLTCKPPEVMFANVGQVKMAKIPGPVAVPNGGMPPYSVVPDPANDLVVTGAPTSRNPRAYVVTDAAGNTATCGTVVAIIPDAQKPTPSPAENALTLTCKPPVFVFAAHGQVKMATIPGPVAVPNGGTSPYAVVPDPDIDLVVTGAPTSSKPGTYVVTDAAGNTATCGTIVAIFPDAPKPTPSPAANETTSAPTEPSFDPTPGGPTPSPTEPSLTPSPAPVCPPGDSICDDPHMQGLRGQIIDWSGVNGGWYSLVKDDEVKLQVNVRLTAPLPKEFPNRQLITGLSILSRQHSVTIEVNNPYNTVTAGCPHGTSPCLANGGLRVIVDGEQYSDLLTSSRDEHVADGIEISASNLPVECRQFGGDKIWARMFDEMLKGGRRLAAAESFESWILRFDQMAAPGWCAQYIEQHDIAHVQSIHAIFKIVTPSVTVRLNAGVNYQGNGELDWDGRTLPDLEFWQMDVGLHGLSVESESLSGILGETARPVFDEDGLPVMEGFDAFRGTVEDYRVSGPLGTDFALLHTEDYNE